MFRDTVKNNIKFGGPEATEEQIVAAAKAARCHDFIMALPKGYNTIIGEATASLDPENEHLIQKAISELTYGRTIITIAHRLATIENADQILVLDQGTVVQKGTHKELIAKEGTYQDFIKIRERAEGWKLM